MLKNLYIKNYALFTECGVGFYKGLNILTGETGAGKSLLVGALGLLLGKRSDTNVIFFPDQKCIVEATFEELSVNRCKELAELGEFDMDGNSVIVRRELSPNGKTRVFINDTPVSVQVLKQAMSMLVDMHGQNESQLLLDPEKQLRLLDDYAGVLPLVDAFKAQLQTANRLKQEIEALEAEEATAKQQFDYYNFLVSELADAQLQADEEETLENELRLLQNSEEIREALRFSVEEVYNGDSTIYQKISQVYNALAKVATFDASIATETGKLSEMRDTLKEITFSLQNVLENVDADPERLAFIEERLGIYHTLKRKYNARTGKELIALYEEYSRKIEHFSSIDENIQALKAALEKEKVALVALGLEIEKIRLAHTELLASKVNELLKEVGFKDAKFFISVTRNLYESGMLSVEGENVRPNATGFNKASFLIQTNPGLPIGALAEIASGGEVSRVMLAIKTALADKAEFPVLIFDEIDTGISGEVAMKVGKVMQKLANAFQILSITHLPQIAAKGTHQYLIFKEVQNNLTTSGVRKLNKEERVLEIAKMIGGENPGSFALQSAQELMG